MRGRGCASEQALARFELDALSQLQRQGRELAELQHELQINRCGCTVHRLICGASAKSVQGPRASCPLRRQVTELRRVLGESSAKQSAALWELSERTVVQLTRHTAALGVLRWHPWEKPCTWEHLGLDSARQALPSMSPGDRQGLEAEVAQAFRKPAMTDRFLTPAARLPRPPGGGTSHSMRTRTVKDYIAADVLGSASHERVAVWSLERGSLQPIHSAGPRMTLSVNINDM